MLGVIDSSYLFSYAVFMFVSGWIAERMDLRYFLSGGMFLSGVCVFFFGFAYTVGIHSYWYLIALQVPEDTPTLLDSRGKNGHSPGATFHQPGRERRTPSDGGSKHQGSFV